MHIVYERACPFNSTRKLQRANERNAELKAQGEIVDTDTQYTPK